MTLQQLRYKKVTPAPWAGVTFLQVPVALHKSQKVVFIIFCVTAKIFDIAIK